MWNESPEQYTKDRNSINNASKTIGENNMKNRIMLIGLTAIALFASVYGVFANDVNPPYVIWNATQIEQNGHSFQIQGIKPSDGKRGEGMAWLADTAELKAQHKPKGGEFHLIGCKEVLIGRHVCKDIQFADGSSVKQSLIAHNYVVRK